MPPSHTAMAVWLSNRAFASELKGHEFKSWRRQRSVIMFRCTRRPLAYHLCSPHMPLSSAKTGPRLNTHHHIWQPVSCTQLNTDRQLDIVPAPTNGPIRTQVTFLEGFNSLLIYKIVALLLRDYWHAITMSAAAMQLHVRCRALLTCQYYCMSAVEKRCWRATAVACQQQLPCCWHVNCMSEVSDNNIHI